MTSYLLTNGSLYGKKISDIFIEDGTISKLGEGLTVDADETIDLEGKVVLPGLVDMHTHLREPGGEEAETILTGSQAAAKGGYVAVQAMPNTVPVADNAAVIEKEFNKGIEAGYVHVQPIGAVTVGEKGKELADLGAMAASEAQVRVFSDDGICVSDPLIMRQAMKYIKALDGVIAQHAQEPRLTEKAQMNEGDVSAELGMVGWPAVAEEAIIARDCLLAQELDTRVHICHISTKGSVEIIKWAKEQGINVTAEVTPHHLMLSDERVKTFNPLFKVNPPLRTDEDIVAVRQALENGIIDCIGTDHAPHPGYKKDCEWGEAAMGMLGLETSLAIVNTTMVDTGALDFEGVANIMSTNPAKIGSLEEFGQEIAEGNPAHLTVFDSEKMWTVEPEELASKANNTPFAGMDLKGKVTHTFYDGTMTVKDGELAL